MRSFQALSRVTRSFLATLMVITGLAVTVLMVWPFFTPGIHDRFRVSGWPVAICVGGLLIPFAARGRRGLIISWAVEISMEAPARH